MLPLCPPEDVFWSPYSGLDALCGNTLMISLDELVKEGLLETSDLPDKIDVTTADFFKVLIPALQMSKVQDVQLHVFLTVMAIMSLRILALPVPLDHLSITSCPK